MGRIRSIWPVFFGHLTSVHHSLIGGMVDGTYLLHVGGAIRHETP